MKNIYKTAKNIMGWVSTGQPSMFLKGGQFFRNPLIWQTYFKNITMKNLKNLILGLKKWGRDPLRFLRAAIQRWDDSEGLKTFQIREISLSETLDYIRKLGNTTAHGLDGIDDLSVKTAAGDLSHPLMHMINFSIRKQTFANRWKISRII